jgi:hypothetical protein
MPTPFRACVLLRLAYVRHSSYAAYGSGVYLTKNMRTATNYAHSASARVASSAPAPLSTTDACSIAKKSPLARMVFDSSWIQPLVLVGIVEALKDESVRCNIVNENYTATKEESLRLAHVVVYKPRENTV